MQAPINASFTGRMDGSTSFGKNNKFGFFPSASVGWVISKEDFFDNIEILDYLAFATAQVFFVNKVIKMSSKILILFRSKVTFNMQLI